MNQQTDALYQELSQKADIIRKTLMDYLADNSETKFKSVPLDTLVKSSEYCLLIATGNMTIHNAEFFFEAFDPDAKTKEQYLFNNLLHNLKTIADMIGQRYNKKYRVKLMEEVK
jgi:hypothetical protein